VSWGCHAASLVYTNTIAAIVSKSGISSNHTVIVFHLREKDSWILSVINNYFFHLKQKQNVVSGSRSRGSKRTGMVTCKIHKEKCGGDLLSFLKNTHTHLGPCDERSHRFCYHHHHHHHHHHLHLSPKQKDTTTRLIRQTPVSKIGHVPTPQGDGPKKPLVCFARARYRGLGVCVSRLMRPFTQAKRGG